MCTDYLSFIEKKNRILQSSGFDIDKSKLHPAMFDFQKDIVRWALKKGKALYLLIAVWEKL